MKESGDFLVCSVSGGTLNLFLRLIVKVRKSKNMGTLGKKPVVWFGEYDNSKENRRGWIIK